MKGLLFTLLLATAALAGQAFAADVGLSISIGQPGFYGQLDLNNVAPPPVINERPVMVQRAPRGVLLAPLYLRVPPGHARNWRRYCARYNACGRPVYFVQDDWYNNVYVPHYRDEHHEFRREDRRDDRRDDRRNEHRDDHRDDRRDNDGGHHDHDHDKDHHNDRDDH